MRERKNTQQTRSLSFSSHSHRVCSRFGPARHAARPVGRAADQHPGRVGVGEAAGCARRGFLRLLALPGAQARGLGGLGGRGRGKSGRRRRRRRRRRRSRRRRGGLGCRHGGRRRRWGGRGNGGGGGGGGSRSSLFLNGRSRSSRSRNGISHGRHRSGRGVGVGQGGPGGGLDCVNGQWGPRKMERGGLKKKRSRVGARSLLSLSLSPYLYAPCPATITRQASKRATSRRIVCERSVRGAWITRLCVL